MLRRLSLLLVLTTGGCLLDFDPALLGGGGACASPGVLRCYDFEDSNDLELRIGGAWVEDPACEGGRCWEHDLQVVGSGSGALRLDTVSGSPGPPVFPINFTDELIAIGEGDEFFAQWQQRFNAGMMRAFAGVDGFEFADGWHQVLITNPDAANQEQNMCGAVQLAVGHDARFDGPTMWHGCAEVVAIERVVDGVDTFLQTGEDAPCRFAEGSPTAPPCVPYPVDEWVTYQVHVSVGTWNTPDSLVRLWMARPGGDRIVVFDSDDVAFAGQSGDGFGKLWLGPTNYRRDPNEVHPVGSTWYDNLIISTRELPDPR